MFNSLADAYQRRSEQQALDVLRASQVYEHIRKDNPRMLQQNFVDFSNPESVSGILNPYGTYGVNPNASPGYNPYSYLPSSYTSGTWYGNNPYGATIWGLNDTARFMIASQEDIEAGRLTTSRVVPVSQDQQPPIKQTEERTEQFSNIVLRGLEDLKINIVKVTEKEKKEEPPKFIVIKNIKPHLDHTGYDNDELDVNKQEFRIIPDTPLNWSDTDEQELSSLSDQMAIYDKAMAHTLWNIPTLDDITREDWQYFRRSALEILQDYRDKELRNPNIDYRAPYRYRPLPAVYKNEDGDIMPDMTVPPPLAFKSVNINGEVCYMYDRCRDLLTEEEWDIFVDRAYAELLAKAKKLKSEDLLNLNRGILETQKEEKPKNNNLPQYNPNDPLSVKLWQIKYMENQYNNHKEFYRNVFRSTMTDEQFDNWWYGTNTINKQVTQAEANRNWARQMTDISIQELNKAVPIDPVQMAQQANNRASTAINNFTKGTMRHDMSAKEAWDNIGYVVSRVHELHLEEQKKAQSQAYYQNMSHDTFKKSLYQYMNSPNILNPNPNYTGQYGTIDPRFGLPSNYVDLTKSPEMDERRAKFLNYCNTTIGQAPLSCIYR